MLRFLAMRMVRTIPVLLAVTFAASILIDLLPGEPIDAVFGDIGVTDAQRAAARRELNLDRSIPERYVLWLGDLVQGDLGRSYRSGQEVSAAFLDRLPVTLELAVVSFALVLVISLPLGILAAQRPGSFVDRCVVFISSSMIASPSFLSALVLVYVFAVSFHVFPVTGWVPLTEDPLANLRHVALPATALALGEIATFTRVLRSDLIATLKEDYIAAARASGLSSRYVLIRHALRPSSFALLTLSGIALGRLLTGTIIVETIFAIPGLGFLAINAIRDNDAVLVQAIVLLASLTYVLLNVLVDVSYSWLDPRVRRSA
jgi:peptide/nickel transport system permease protein